MLRGTALITGASSGIGAVYADRLARRGYGLLLVARDRVRMEAIADRLASEARVPTEVLSADLVTDAGLEAVEDLLASRNDIVVLVNNAGMGGGTPLHQESPNGIDRLIALNVRAATRIAAAAASRFAQNRSGTIINIGSVTALFPEELNPVYPATKAYLLALTQSMVPQLEPLGVRVQIVLPGATRTEIWARSGQDVDALPPEIVMEAEDLVDAALAGLDLGELVTIPSLSDHGAWERFEDARCHLRPHLSKSRPAARYLWAGSSTVFAG